ncbi:hypothetical protein EVAR_53230_1 [Eumeta japonica]|uniref:Uncharacterized protein n=1 Tax=Eumeta variegata TaxID=151549 RepID=A0A4C1XGI5_EUMVA|nr:hypothetical protein EVAR_53230_1 [Eumeta japonica]
MVTRITRKKYEEAAGLDLSVSLGGAMGGALNMEAEGGQRDFVLKPRITIDFKRSVRWVSLALVSHRSRKRKTPKSNLDCNFCQAFVEVIAVFFFDEKIHPVWGNSKANCWITRHRKQTHSAVKIPLRYEIVVRCCPNFAPLMNWIALGTDFFQEETTANTAASRSKRLPDAFREHCIVSLKILGYLVGYKGVLVMFAVYFEPARKTRHVPRARASAPSARAIPTNICFLLPERSVRHPPHGELSV